MSQEEKKDGCCSTPAQGNGCGCCKCKKFFMLVIALVLAFTAGALFAKKCPLGGSGKICPMSGEPMSQGK